MNNEPKEWFDSREWYDTPEWYEEEETKLMDKFLNEEEHDCIDVFMKKHASERFLQYTKNYRIQKQKDMEREITLESIIKKLGFDPREDTVYFEPKNDWVVDDTRVNPFHVLTLEELNFLFDEGIF